MDLSTSVQYRVSVKVGRDVADYDVRDRLRAVWLTIKDTMRLVTTAGLASQHLQFDAIYHADYKYSGATIPSL